ncbi:Uncharacterised protein [Mycobacteroides abscessus subsp. abscessus]|nr:Uncharacterised protein [Mycobacteroides abscessus subsp. abscessus]
MAAPTAARIPTVLSSRPRPAAVRIWRSLLTVVWNNTVGNRVSSAICPPSRMGAPGPWSTSCRAETANTLLGTTRAVTVAGIDRAYMGFSRTRTRLGCVPADGVTPSTAPTSTPRYLTSERGGSPSPTLCRSAMTFTYRSSTPVELISSPAVMTATRASAAPPRTSS